MDIRRVEINVTEGDKSLNVSLESYAEGWDPKAFSVLLDNAYDDMREQFGRAGIE